MILLNKTRLAFSVFIAFFIIFFSIVYPELSKAALLEGITLCTDQLLLAIFPFLIVAQMLVFSGAITPIGYLLNPLAKILGFKNKNVGGIILLQLVGGFTPAVNALAQAVRAQKLTSEQGARLLPAIVCMGPSFIILAVGVGHFGNSLIGYYLFISQILACWFVSLVLKITLPTTDFTQASENIKINELQNPQSSTPFSSMISDSFFAFLRLCSVVIFMRFFSTGLYQILPAEIHYLPAFLLEITSGTAILAQSGPYSTYLVCICLSLQGLSILMQVSALVPQSVSLKYLYLSRIIHLPISLFILWLLLRIPNAQTVYNSFSPRLITMQRISTEQAILIFIVCIFTTYHLQKILLVKSQIFTNNKK